MDKMYAIHWKSRTNGRTGTGKTLFDLEEATQLADELNRDYPEILHEPKDMRERQAQPVPEPVAESQEVVGATA